MKKILAALICALCMLSSTFAIGFGAGAKGFLGTDFDTTATVADMGTQIKSLDAQSNLDFGFGAYTYLYLLGGLGVQAEANVTRGKTTFSGLPNGQTTDFELWTLDIPLMLWFNSDISRFSLGAGVGPNFAFNLQSGDLKSLYEQTSASAKDNLFTIGLCVGADVKFYFTDHIGLVVGARYINDFKKTDVPVVVGDYDTGKSYPTVSTSRKALYGNVGLEFRLF